MKFYSKSINKIRIFMKICGFRVNTYVINLFHFYIYYSDCTPLNGHYLYCRTLYISNLQGQKSYYDDAQLNNIFCMFNASHNQKKSIYDIANHVKNQKLFYVFIQIEIQMVISNIDVEIRNFSHSQKKPSPLQLVTLGVVI